jgi:hypothetical protein
MRWFNSCALVHIGRHYLALNLLRHIGPLLFLGRPLDTVLSTVEANQDAVVLAVKPRGERVVVIL